jgi:tripartite-type tricarboxylate transporter receptor subunit TctC
MPQRTKKARRQVLGAIVALTAALSTPLALAQSDKPIKLLIGFPAGGAADGVARVLADRLSPILKQPVVVENKPGVGGRLAAQAVKAAAPDGLTYMVAPNATFVFQHLVFPLETLGFDVTRDFTAVARLSSYPVAMVANTSTGVKNVKDYLAWRKTPAGQPTFGTAGQGGETHFNGLQFGKLTGLEMTGVPYRGNAPLNTDLVGGQILMANMVAGDALQFVKAGKLNYLGVFSRQRSALLPEVPTMIEQGYDTGGDDAWMGMWAPGKLAPAELARMQDALRQVLSQPATRELMLQRLLQVADYRAGADVDKAINAELAHWGPIVKASGFKPQ